MQIVHKSKSCPFNLIDWYSEDIVKIFAGDGCIMAITKEGKVLQKVEDEKLAARLEYWTNVRTIAISQYAPALAVALLQDGTCMVSKRALRAWCCERERLSFDEINEQVRALKNIVEIAVLDCIFALDDSGKVHHIPLWRRDGYGEVKGWENVCHIVAGSQGAVFGITCDGKILCAGGTCIRGAHGDLRKHLNAFCDAVDICAIGSECEEIFVARADGRVVDLYGKDLAVEHSGKRPVFDSNCSLAAMRLKDFKVKCVPHGWWEGTFIPEGTKVSHMAVGMNAFRPFILWIKK